MAALIIGPGRPIKHICDAIEVAHVKIQKDFDHINPVVGLINRMRDHDIPADLITIDCLKTGKRILLMAHDNQPELANYQFCRRDEYPADEFESIAIESLTAQKLYDWMKETFSSEDLRKGQYPSNSTFKTWRHSLQQLRYRPFGMVQ